ncbi:hypothetical protein IMSAG049_01679 [Clostridiales bacterium]|nr:hypothetical protein IMSAG049_01679 [Clostridiales bacterium]
MIKEHMLFNVAEYIRLSRDDGDKAESDSIVNQRKLISDFLKDKDNFVLFDTYIDDGLTGTNFNRPSFKRMIKDIEAGNVNCVIVKDLSRFGRDYIDTGKYLERYFPDNGVRFISITDNIDSMKQAYDMLLPIKNIFNEQYARDISKKVHASMKTKQRAGEFIGAFASYGYKKSPSNKNKLIIDEYAAEIVRKIFKLYIDGYGKIRIAAMLNEEGIACPSEYKRINGDNYKNSNRLDSTYYWTYSTINHILQNEMYIGNMVQNKKIQRMRKKSKIQDKEDWIVVKGTHEAIIDEITWDKAQTLLKRRTRSLDLNSNISVFAGFLKCGDCSRSLVKKIWKSGHESRSVNYYCGAYVRSGNQYCTPHHIKHSVIEKIILEDLKIIIQSIDNMREIIEQNQDTAFSVKLANENDEKRLRAELERLKKLKKTVYEDYISELITKDEFVAYRQDYLRKEELLEKQLESINKRQDKAKPNIFHMPWIKRLLELRDIERLDRNIVVEMIQEIKVYEDHKIKITYNFSNELEMLFKTVYTNNENI